MIESVRARSARYVPERLDAPLELVSVRLPEYPEDARQLGTEGHVVVELTVDVDGTVKSVLLLQSTNRALNRPSLEALRQWRFKPPTKDGKPTSIRVAQPLTFKARG